ncbi:MAG: SUMF1/EgtB/PvdO family nonheme iron enzyme [Proteobacteria bacterium]|nr:SUMF1/EgtB/PvdO family nonheme iron enzyme [Pseudomonadota bacterium]
MQAQPRERTAPVDTLRAELTRARGATDALFAGVPEASMFDRPVAERHRLAFYVGHLEAFDANLLLAARAGVRAVDPLDRLFAFGIDPVGTGLPQDAPGDWPPLAEIRRYARRTRDRVDAWLSAQPTRPVDDGAWERLHTAIEHRWMHAETLAYLVNRLERSRMVRNVPAVARASAEEKVAIAAGEVTLGLHAGFGWDNERAVHRVHVPAFRIDRRMVTNGQYLRFVEAGGYRDAQCWAGDDWQWIEEHEVRHPASWRAHDGAWTLVSRYDLVPFQSDWPVYLSHAEASAYARWRGARLPTEAEWMRAAYGEGDAPYPWGAAAPDATRGNFDLGRWDPLPVDAHPRGASAAGVEGLLGNGWEWTSTPFGPYAGFRAADYYPGYSADFFDGRHFVLKGGSAHTARPLLRRSFRNWFQPHYPYVFAGFRCVEDA